MSLQVQLHYIPSIPSPVQLLIFCRMREAVGAHWRDVDCLCRRRSALLRGVQMKHHEIGSLGEVPSTSGNNFRLLPIGEEKGECQINHTGFSSSMEMEAAAILWQRSIKECNMRYTCILSDGDSKTFQHLMSLNIYGKGKPIKKEECINHISKRLGTGLRSKVKEWRSKGVCIGGKKVGSLKETTIVMLTNFYRKAIKDHCNDVEKMKRAIYATLYHCSSTDAKPKHNKCPKVSNRYKKNH
ncbi:uncharacterized protein TNCV_3506541 [Trichonephila clavipes]|uniref:Mutator-like transposase domain-containing protein n=1 Tax=Trichonephila clavipes TaxID=2585209 RepID=A0A8X6RX86_TRICX|nr:uncharacterized protein TNCV_3506541 [Trichonephila clavipes]